MFVQAFEIGLNLVVAVWQELLQLFLTKIPGLAVDSLAFPPIKGNQCSANKVKFLTENGTRSAHVFARLRMIFAKICNRFKIWGELPQSPHQCNVTLGRMLERSTRTDLVSIAVYIKFEHVSGMIGGPPGLGGGGMGKVKRFQIKTLNEDIKKTNRVCCIYLVVYDCRKK